MPHSPKIIPQLGQIVVQSFLEYISVIFFFFLEGGVTFGTGRRKSSPSHTGLSCVCLGWSNLWAAVLGAELNHKMAIQWHLWGGRRAVFILVLGVKLPPCLCSCWHTKGSVLVQGDVGIVPPHVRLCSLHQTHPALVPCSVFSQVSSPPNLKCRWNHGLWILRFNLMVFAVCWKLIYCSFEIISLSCSLTVLKGK